MRMNSNTADLHSLSNVRRRVWVYFRGLRGCFMSGRKWKSRNCFWFVALHNLNNGFRFSGPKSSPNRCWSWHCNLSRYPHPVGMLLPVGNLFWVFGATSALPYVWPKDHGEFISTQLTSPERVTTGVGVTARGAETKTDSLTGWLRPALRSWNSSIFTSALLTKMAM